MIHHAVHNLFHQHATNKQLTLIAGPCVVESFEICKEIAERMLHIATKKNIGYIFKASYDKANRTSAHAFRGPGIEEGLDILARIRADLQVPVLTDIHLPEQAAQAAGVVDVLQIPAFLCRQTDLLKAAATTGLATNIKKAQFLAPDDMYYVAQKFEQYGGKHFALTERGSSFGYHQLVVDMRSLVIMRQKTGRPIIFDATHSVQSPGSAQGATGGDRNMAPVLARAAAAVGIDGLFCEVHPNPDQALSDGPNSLTPEMMASLLDDVCAIHERLHSA